MDSWQLPGCICIANDAASALPMESGSHSSMNNAIILEAVIDMALTFTEFVVIVN